MAGWLIRSGIPTVALLAAVALSGCTSAADGTITPTSSTSPEATPARTPSASPTPTPLPPRQIGFTCTYEKPGANSWEPATYETRSFSSAQEVWAVGTPAAWCEMKVVMSGPIATIEIEAAKVANLSTIDNLRILWEMCASLDHLYATNGALNPAQQAEANAVLMLCPDHPGAAIMANGSPEQNERIAGVRFGAGVREVGTQIQSGTYRASGQIENCYWERLDASGGTIDNHFVIAATQVEVTVEATDFALNTQNCGEFVKVG